MKIKVSMAIMSHLSDAQDLMMIGGIAQANKHINFSKKLILKYVNTDEDVNTEELDKMWQEK